MHRSQGKNNPQYQEPEIRNIESHHDFIKKVLKWSISDLDHIITLLKVRVTAEELYLQALSKIMAQPITTPESHIYFGGVETTLYKALTQYETTINQTVIQRKGLVNTMNAEIAKLQDMKEKHESWRNNIKKSHGDRNKSYINQRRELAKLQKAYTQKCVELHNAQATQQASLAGNDGDVRDGDNSSNRRSMDDMRGLSTLRAQMTQVRSQFASATSQMMDASKANAKFVKIKSEISVADEEYRGGVRALEEKRKQQIEIATKAHMATENIIQTKGNTTKEALRAILDKESAILANEMTLIETSIKSTDEINTHTDIYLFNMEYNRKQFTSPSYIPYENYYHKGKCSDLLFGQSLDEYVTDHSRSVPILVTKCIDAVERLGGLQKEGIYRISGRQSNIEALKNAFEQNEAKVDFYGESKYDVFVIADVLKIYLRELKQPLFPYPVKERMDYATHDQQTRLPMLQTRLATLPKHYRDTLHVVIRHLARVNSYNQANKMNLQNLSVVFTPALFHDHNNAEVPGDWRCDAVFEDLVTYHEPLFAKAEAQSQSLSGTNTISRTPPPSGGGMLLTAPLNPSNLTGALAGPGVNNHYGPFDNPPIPARPGVRDPPSGYYEPIKHQRSSSLTPQNIIVNPSTAMTSSRELVYPYESMGRLVQGESDKTEVQSPVIPLHTVTDFQTDDPSPARVATAAVPTVVDNTSAMGFESTDNSGSNHVSQGQTDRRLRTGPVQSPISSIAEDSSPLPGTTAPPRQDAFRMQAILAQNATSSSSSSTSVSPVKKPPSSQNHPIAASPTGRQHVPSATLSANLVSSFVDINIHPTATSTDTKHDDTSNLTVYASEAAKSSQ